MFETVAILVSEHFEWLLCLGGRSHEAYSSRGVILSVSQSVSQSFRRNDFS